MLNRFPQHPSGILFIFDDHNSQSVQRLLTLLFRPALNLLRSRKGQLNSHGCPFALSFTVRGDRAAMHLSYGANDIEAEAQTAMLSGSRCIGLPEPVEYEGQKFRTDTLACVTHTDVVSVIYALIIDLNRTALTCELKRVCQEVINNL